MKRRGASQKRRKKKKRQFQDRPVARGIEGSVALFVVAALLTPPDIISQIALGLPILILFEASLFAMRWTGDSDAS